ncbi:MAG: hypothetical protein KAJ16_10565 [Calditrichia bacterium]|nr:hypothetical protein [Calditrichia bacterium]
MKKHIPKRLATIGGILISISGLLNTILGLQIGAIYYEVYPGGNMGHVGIVAGLAALVLGLAIVFLVVPLYRKDQRGLLILAGILTLILGHLGAIAGALYIGTLGVILCYIAGIWILLAGLKK